MLRGDTLSPGARRRLAEVFTTDDPTGELGTAWGVKEGLRPVLTCRTLHGARDATQRLERRVRAADTDETTTVGHSQDTTVKCGWPLWSLCPQEPGSGRLARPQATVGESAGGDQRGT